MDNDQQRKNAVDSETLRKFSSDLDRSGAQHLYIKLYIQTLKIKKEAEGIKSPEVSLAHLFPSFLFQISEFLAVCLHVC